MTAAKIMKVRALVNDANSIISWQPDALPRAKRLLEEAVGMLDEALTAVPRGHAPKVASPR